MTFASLIKDPSTYSSAGPMVASSVRKFTQNFVVSHMFYTNNGCVVNTTSLGHGKLHSRFPGYTWNRQT